MTQSNADVVYYQQVCVTPRRLHPVFPLISPVLQEAPCAPRYEEGVAGDTQPVRPGGAVGRRGAVVAEERQRGADRR